MESFELRAASLVLDQPTTADVERITRYCQDPIFETFMTLPWPYEREHAECFVTDYVPAGWASGDEVTWALRHPDAGFLGVIGVRRPSAMVGFWMGAEHRGKGHMSAALRVVADWAFETEFCDPVRWECVVGNLASASVARKAGFTFMGTGPATVTSRDGSHPPSWHGEFRSTDDLTPKPGWPAAD